MMCRCLLRQVKSTIFLEFKQKCRTVWFCYVFVCIFHCFTWQRISSKVYFNSFQKMSAVSSRLSTTEFIHIFHSYLFIRTFICVDEIIKMIYNTKIVMILSNVCVYFLPVSSLLFSFLTRGYFVIDVLPVKSAHK